jgi:hypothetical protein
MARDPTRNLQHLGFAADNEISISLSASYELRQLTNRGEALVAMALRPDLPTPWPPAVSSNGTTSN